MLQNLFLKDWIQSASQPVNYSIYIEQINYVYSHIIKQVELFFFTKRCMFHSNQKQMKFC